MTVPQPGFTSKVIRAIAVAIALAAPSLALAADDPVPLDPSIEALAIALAETPEQHATLAAFYAGKAAEARAAADQHRSMAMSYSGKREVYAGHCRNLARVYGELAAEYDALANGHRESSTAGRDSH